MKNASFRSVAAALLSLAALLASPAASAQMFRAYVASDGLDANPCTLTAPCRLLPAALTAVAAGGEIWMLDSANYNTAPVTINKSVTILAVPGAVGSIVASGGDGLTINGAAIRVTLKSLVFVNLSAGTNGVRLLQGATLTILDSHFSGLTAGVAITGNVGTKTQITRSTFNSNTYGLYVSQGVAMSIDSDYFNNTIAIYAIGNGGSDANSGNGPPNGPVRVRLSGGNIVDNGTGIRMENAGLRAQGACNGANVFVRSNPSQYTVNATGNTTYLSVVGSSDQQVACGGFYQVGMYGYGLNN